MPGGMKSGSRRKILLDFSHPLYNLSRHMRDDSQTKLEQLGLSAAEAQVYFALVRSGGTLGASAVAAATGVPRTNVYPVLKSLVDRGIVEAEQGYGSRFTAVRPKEALPSLIVRAREDLFQRETLAGELVEHLESLAEPRENNGESELIQVLRDPRSVSERYDRLRLEAKRAVEVFVKAPIFARPGPDPVFEEVLRRGVRCRGLYERAILDAPAVAPYLARWIAQGDEVRVYDGELPHKLAIFDSQIVLMPLIRPGEPTKTVLIRHPQLAQSLGLAFEHLWEQSNPIAPPKRKKISTPVLAQSDVKLQPHIERAAPAEKDGNATGFTAGRDGHRPSRRTKKLNR